MPPGVVAIDCLSYSPGGRRWPLRPDEGELTALGVLCHDLSSSRVLNRARLEDKSWHGLVGVMLLRDIPLTLGLSPSRGEGSQTEIRSYTCRTQAPSQNLTVNPAMMASAETLLLTEVPASAPMTGSAHGPEIEFSKACR